MKLKVLSLWDVEQVRQWRNLQIEILRTSFILTQEQQSKFYHEIVCNRQANARYWGIWTDKTNRVGFELIGMCGLENIQWENRLAEISMVLNPEYPLDEYGEKALELLLHEGFMNLNLENIFAEVYYCNPYLKFWLSIIKRENPCDVSDLPNRKYYNGKYWGSYYINFNKGAINK